MAKRSKRLKTGIESIKEEIEAHFKKIEEDINNEDLDGGRYHIKELKRSLIDALKYKLSLLGKEDIDIKNYEERLDSLNKKLENKSE